MKKNNAIKKIVANYGELALKGKNHTDFVRVLKRNVFHLLSDIPCQIKVFFDHIEITEFADDQSDEIKFRLRHFIGISNFHECMIYPLDEDLSKITDGIIALLQGKHSYKFEVKRKYKQFKYNSIQIKQILAAFVRNHPDINHLSVNVINPETIIYVNVTINGIEVFSEKCPGLNGLPVSSSGKLLMLISGGIDSPVASHLLMVRGFKVDFLTFVTPPFTSEKNVDKVIALIKQLTLKGKLCINPRLFVCHFSNVQNELAHLPKTNYRIIMMRRCFMRIGEMLLKKYHYDALATGDACGQVASQTIQSLTSISDAVAKDSLILRPLVGMNKSWIIDYAKKIGTYDYSIAPIEDSCSEFAPKNPITKPKISTIQTIEQASPLLNDLISLTFKNDIKVIEGDELINYEVRNLYSDTK